MLAEVEEPAPCHSDTTAARVSIRDWLTEQPALGPGAWPAG